MQHLSPLIAAACILLASYQASAANWDPATSRVVVISLAGFAGETPGNTSFSTNDRLDDPLVGRFLKLGVPDASLLYLKDDNATTENVKTLLPRFLKRSKPDETLIFYYSSHGGYDPKTGAHTYTTFDGSIGIGWFIGNIEASFKGKQVMLFSDCCYSGGMVNLAKGRGPDKTDISYAALSTTGSANLGYSGWRFTDVLYRAWTGDPAMDADRSGTVDFHELCVFAERYMAFVAEGKPLYATTGSFDTSLVLSETSREAKPGIGERLLVNDGGTWFKAEVTNVKNGQLRVHFTDKSRYDRYAWVDRSETRKFSYPTYKIGTRVQIRNTAGKWCSGVVIDAFENMHECHFDGKSDFYDEWMSPSRIRLPQ